MDESAEQAVNLSVNIAIFVIALTVSLTLLFKVRDIADLAVELDNKIPDGSMVLSTQNIDNRIISGYELISYYYNYIKPYYTDEENTEYNHNNVGVVIKSINKEAENGYTILKKEFVAGSIANISTLNNNLNFQDFKEAINLNANYVLSVNQHYDNTNSISGTTVIHIEEVPELYKAEIYNYYNDNVKDIFRDPDTSNYYEPCTLRIIIKENNKNAVIYFNEDILNGDEKVKEFLNNLDGSKKYSVRIKRENLRKNMTSSSIVLYIQ